MDLKYFQNGMWKVLRCLGGTIPNEREREKFSRYIFDLFYRKTARKKILRSLWSHYSLREGSRDRLAFPLEPLFLARRHVRSACVPSRAIIPCEKALEIGLRCP